jgi:cytochrome bd-type quinol oxidase subunit 2
MMNTVAPVWDGNETWMVLGGAGLFAAFPMVYSNSSICFLYTNHFDGDCADFPWCRF